ncbi:MAG: hypothetical protein VX438_13965, partial [Planctomycetota bacterium]|nr:hypothetical protein [Planctomycetota bacterium]
MAPKIFYVGSEQEVAQHAQPLINDFDVEVIEADAVVAAATCDDLAIFFSEHFERFRTAIYQLKEKRCRT